MKIQNMLMKMQSILTKLLIIWISKSTQIFSKIFSKPFKLILSMVSRLYPYPKWLVMIQIYEKYWWLKMDFRGWTNTYGIVSTTVSAAVKYQFLKNYDVGFWDIFWIGWYWLNNASYEIFQVPTSWILCSSTVSTTVMK